MNLWWRICILSILVFSRGNASLEGQVGGLRPAEGETYFLKFSMIQETESDNRMINRNLSLELSGDIQFQFRGTAPDTMLLFNARYQDLLLSFFSPTSNLFISSEQETFSNLRNFLAFIQDKDFTVHLSPFGECVQVNGIDSLIGQFSESNDIAPERNELFTRTVHEAFGNEAFTSLVNLALHIYPTGGEVKNGIMTSLVFNARPLPLRENFFQQQGSAGQTRVQGIGVIPETFDTLSYNSMKLISTVVGNQTYDFLVNEETGWPVDGISKQKIQSVSQISGHPELPEGLKIPSVTITDYTFSGGVIARDKKRRR